MEQIRKEHLSIYYWLVDLLPSFVTVTREFPLDEDLVLPSVSVTSEPGKGVPFELGGSDQTRRMWNIHIFTKNIGQRDDYTSLIFRSLEDCITVYDYDQGFPPDSIPQLGSLMIENRSYKPVRVYEDLVRKMYWRGLVNFESYYEPA